MFLINPDDVNQTNGGGGGSAGQLTSNTTTGGGIFINSLPVIDITNTQFVDKTTPISTNNVQLNPTITTNIPHVDPPFTFRAKIVRDMYSFVMSDPLVNFTYNVGKPISVIPVTCSFRNNTTNTALQLDFISPNFIDISIGSTVLVDSDQIIKFFLMLNESASIQLVNTANIVFKELIEINVIPSNITEPVYVRNNLQSLTI